MSHPIKILEPEEIAKLLDAPYKKTDKAIRDRAILAVLFSTGVRVSELCGMDVADIRDNRVTVFGKRKKYRLVLLSDFAKHRIAQWRQVRYSRSNDNPALFTTVNGARRIGVRTIQLLVRRYALDVGLVGVHTHTLRHCFAVDALRNGADIRQVQVMLGHASPTTTAIYLSMSDHMVEEAHLKFHGASEVYARLENH